MARYDYPYSQVFDSIEVLRVAFHPQYGIMVTSNRENIGGIEMEYEVECIVCGVDNESSVCNDCNNEEIT